MMGWSLGCVGSTVCCFVGRPLLDEALMIGPSSVKTLATNVLSPGEGRQLSAWSLTWHGNWACTAAQCAASGDVITGQDVGVAVLTWHEGVACHAHGSGCTRELSQTAGGTGQLSQTTGGSAAQLLQCGPLSCLWREGGREGGRKGESE